MVIFVMSTLLSHLIAHSRFQTSVLRRASFDWDDGVEPMGAWSPDVIVSTQYAPSRGGRTMMPGTRLHSTSKLNIEVHHQLTYPLVARGCFLSQDYCKMVGLYE